MTEQRPTATQVPPMSSLKRSVHPPEGIRVFDEWQREAPVELAELVSNPRIPLGAAFEDIVEEALERQAITAFRPSKALMPRIMQHFGIHEASYAGKWQRQELASLRTHCDHCPSVGKCWRAVRSGVAADECRVFCPNAPAFDAKAVEMVPLW